jgi:hypothetical protein
VSFFVIIVVVPYLIAIVAFVKPAWLQHFSREWPWEGRRRLPAHDLDQDDRAAPVR